MYEICIWLIITRIHVSFNDQEFIIPIKMISQVESSFAVFVRGFSAARDSFLRLQARNRIFKGLTRLTYCPRLAVAHLHLYIKAPHKNIPESQPRVICVPLSFFFFFFLIKFACDLAVRSAKSYTF